MDMFLGQESIKNCASWSFADQKIVTSLLKISCDKNAKYKHILSQCSEYFWMWMSIMVTY